MLTTIRGYLHSNENNLGRSVVVNLDLKSHNNIRMVDHRTIYSIIIRNIKYILKEGKRAKDLNPIELPSPNVDA